MVTSLDGAGDVRHVPAARIVVLGEEAAIARGLNAHEEVELGARPEMQGAGELDLVLDDGGRAAALDQCLVIGRELEFEDAVEQCRGHRGHYPGAAGMRERWSRRGMVP